MTSVLLIGLGRMGGALMSRWAAGQDDALYFIDHTTPSHPGAVKLAVMEDVATLPRPLVVVLAVKPAAGVAVLAELAPWLDDQDLVLSVMAGVSLETLRDACRANLDLVRAMPNIAFALGRSATAAVAAPGVSPSNLATCAGLLTAGGGLTWLNAERDLDAATAVAGSGLAYLFAFTEHLAQAGVALGLSSDSATALARDVLAGAGVMATAGESLATLRERITSPGGTTAAALSVFSRDDDLKRLVRRAAQAAADRSAELAVSTSPSKERPPSCP